MAFSAIVKYTSMQTPIFSKVLSIGLLQKLFTFTIVLTYSTAIGQVSVIMNHNDYSRTGWNKEETVLNVENVSSGNFGKIFSREVDDQIFAQPLVVSSVSIAGGVHNIVIVATVNNSIYAFNADDRSISRPYWKASLTFDSANYRPVRNSDMVGACTFLPQGYSDFPGNIGIVGTPAIDTATKTIYAVARSRSKEGSEYVQYLHALDLLSGQEKKGSPVMIKASYSGNGDGNMNGTITFDPQKQNQRAGLLLHNGIVYVCWASHCGWGPYHGWMIGYDASTLQQKYVYNTTPNGEGAGIWMSGQPPSVDEEGNILITTGNGTTGYNENPDDPINRGSSLIKLSPDLKIIDFFTPANYDYLNRADRDYGINGPLIIPNTHLSVSGSKDGGLYLVDNNNMGGTRLLQEDVLQRINFGEWGTVNTKHLYGSPVYFKDNEGNEYIYGWAQGAYLKQIPFNRESMRFDTINAIVGNSLSASGYMPGGILSVSSNQSQAGTGILWVTNAMNGNANHSAVPGVLQAFDAKDITRELWNSNWNRQRDSLGKFAKFAPPTIANGKVYIATFSKKLNVYGLNPPAISSCSQDVREWNNANIGNVTYPGEICHDNGLYYISTSGNDLQSYNDAFHYLFRQTNSNEAQLTIRVEPSKTFRKKSKSGIMFRENLSPGSRFLFLGITDSGRIISNQRSDQNNYSFISKYIFVSKDTAYYLRINRNGSEFKNYYSANGSEWIKLNTINLSLGENPHLGIAYANAESGKLDTTVIKFVSLIVKHDLAENIQTFTAKKNNNKHVILSWTVSEQGKNEYFEIQRSINETDFTTIGRVNKGGSSANFKDYVFTDYNPFDATNYYRVKQVDKYGKITYTPVLSVEITLKPITVFPNPASNTIYIQSKQKFTNGEKISVRLLDYSGRQLKRAEFLPDYFHTSMFHLNKAFSSGIYFLLITNSRGDSHVEKISILQRK